MNVINLFSGMEVGRQVAKELGWNINKWYSSELDKYAMKVANKNHDDLIQLGDITKWKEWDIDWSSIDLIMAGSPCQGFSRAGKGLNFEDKRSKLFFAFIDILNHVRELKPNVKFMLENVHMKKEWREVISEYLGVEYIDINSSLVSAQKRPRLYWTNIDGVELPRDRNINLVDILEYKNAFHKDDYISFGPGISRDQKAMFSFKNNQLIVKNATKKGYLVVNQYDCINLSCPNILTRRGRVANNKTNTLDTQCNQAVYYDGYIRKLTTLECERLQTLPDNYTSIKKIMEKKTNPVAIRGRKLNKATIVGRRLNPQGHREDYNKNIPITQCLEVRKTERNKSNCLTTVLKDNVLTPLPIGRHPDAFKRKLPFRYYTIRECERLQTLPDNYTEGVSNTQRYKMLGNGWTLEVIKHILSYYKAE